MLLLLLAASLPHTQPLALTGDPARQMVDGIAAHLERATRAAPAGRRPTRERLREILGAGDRRVGFRSPELAGTLAEPALICQGSGYSVYSVRWPVLEGLSAEGLLWNPAGVPKARAVVIPDAGESPERLPLAARLAAAGCQVLSPLTLDLATVPKTQQTRREFIYRMAFEMGRHLIGYEIQKTLAAVDWYGTGPIGVWGHGEGGMLALFAAALDDRITVAGVSGYTGPGPGLAGEPIYRNVWSLLRDFGRSDIERLIAPRTLTSDEAAFARALGVDYSSSPQPPIPNPRLDMERQFQEMIGYTQRLVARSEGVRDALWAKAGPEAVRRQLAEDVIGRLPASSLPLNPRTRQSEHGYEVMLDVAPGVFAYGILRLPKDLRPGERRPVVVVQHGLEGRAEDMFATSGTPFRYYQNIGGKLADLGFIVYSPQNPYIGDFRRLQRLANPPGLSIFSFIVAQHQRLLDWLVSLDFVDPQHIAFYGLSYGGKTALRVPALEPRYMLSICSGDFNEWIRKMTSVDAPYSYMFTREWEMYEWNMAHVASHAEMAKLIAPRPFMVERGHRDGVGVDEWVAYEYAKVRRFYDEAGLGARTRIEFFNGPHQIHGAGTVEFLRQFLAR